MAFATTHHFMLSCKGKTAFVVVVAILFDLLPAIGFMTGGTINFEILPMRRFPVGAINKAKPESKNQKN
jgi:hypothetical protein